MSKLLAPQLFFTLLLLPSSLFCARVEERHDLVVLVIELELLIAHVRMLHTELIEVSVSFSLLFRQF